MCIIPTFNVFKYAASSFLTCRVITEKYVLLLPCSDEALDHAVVPAIAFAAHATYDPI